MMFESIFNNYWPSLAALFFALLFFMGKISERDDRRDQKSWISTEGEIVRVFRHPKLIAYYIGFTHEKTKYYFEERRTLGDIAYKVGKSVPILFDPGGSFLTTIPDQDQKVFASKVAVGSQQQAKIIDNSLSSMIMDIVNIGLVLLCVIVQWLFLIK